MFTRKVIYTFSKYTELLFQAGQATYMRVKQQLKSWFLRAAERLQQQINVQTLEVTACSIHLNDWTKQPLNDPGCQYKMMRKYLKNNLLITFYIALCCIICIQVYNIGLVSNLPSFPSSRIRILPVSCEDQSSVSLRAEGSTKSWILRWTGVPNFKGLAD